MSVNIKDYWTLEEFANDIITEAVDDDYHIKISIIDPNEFVKKNPSTQQVKSSVFFDRLGAPNPEGLLSYQLFGMTKEERAGIFGYIDLSDYFINPLIYKKLFRLDRKFKEIVHGIKRFSINSSGELVEDEDNGGTGLKWLKANFNKIKIKRSDSNTRKKHIKFIKDNENKIFMNKLLVMPAYYRDVNTEQKGKISVGEINELYANIISNVNGIKETADYGIDVTDSIKGRIQESILAVYDWICGNSNNLLEGATGLSKKTGIIRRAGLAKTSDYGSRLVLSAPNLKTERVDDLMVDCRHSAVPLASLLANFLPFVIFQVKRFIDDEFSVEVPVYNLKTGKVEFQHIDDIQTQFTDEVIKEKIENFIHGYSNRFQPFTVKLNNGKECNIKFRARDISPLELERLLKTGENTDFLSSTLDDSNIDRVITWCDIFFIAATEAVKHKCVLITRYPIDSMYNQFPSEVVVSSTKETEPIFYNGQVYKYYPKIRAEDIGSNTSNVFVDTLRISNLLLKAIGGDYDGDQVSVKGVFTKEANSECMEYINNKLHYIGMDGSSIRTTTNESVQSIYTLTLALRDDRAKLKPVKF